MVDVIKAPFQIGVQDVFCLVVDLDIDGRDSILTAASRTQAIGIWLEFCLPYWFQSQFDASLMRSRFHDRNPSRTFFELAWFRDRPPSHRLGFDLLPGLWVNAFSHCTSSSRFERFHAINSCGFLALVVLGHSPYCQQSCCPGRASPTFEACELLVGCHVARLERWAFVACTHAAQTCARAACANSHSQDQAAIAVWSWVPSSLFYDLCLFLPSHRAHVSLSWALPQAFAF